VNRGAHTQQAIPDVTRAACLPDAGIEEGLRSKAVPDLPERFVEVLPVPGNRLSYLARGRRPAFDVLPTMGGRTTEAVVATCAFQE